MVDTFTEIPKIIAAGDSLSLRLTRSSFLASAGWKLNLVLATSGKTPIVLDSTVDGDAHLFTKTPDETKSWGVANYAWTLVASYGTTKRISIESGRIKIVADPLNLPAGYDPRSYQEQALEMVEKALAGNLEDGVKSFEIRGTKIEFMGPDMLRRERSRLQQEIRLQRGEPMIGAIGVRLQ